MRPYTTLAAALALAFGAQATLAAPQKLAAKKRPAASAKAVATKAPLVLDTPAYDKELNEAELAISSQVDEGSFACGDGGAVTLTADQAKPGHFTLAHQNQHYRVSPRVSVTGAVRLENTAGSVVWLQLANKSMLLAPKQSRRLADDCMSEKQHIVAAGLRNAPARSLFDPEPEQAIASNQSSSVSAAAAIMGGQ